MNGVTPLEIDLTPEEMELLDTVGAGEKFTLRGQEYVFAVRSRRTLEWIFYTEEATYKISSEKDS